MDSTALYAQFRNDVSDTVVPYLWSAVEVLDYINDAQQQFCRATGGFTDASSALTALDYAAGADALTLSPLILTIRGAYDNTTGKPLEVVNFEDMATRGWRFDGRPGVVRALVIGLGATSARLYPLPVLGGTVRLVCERLPLAPITDLDQVLEVPDQHQYGLSLWLRARAYGKQDVETYDPKKSDNFAAQFRAYCDQARREKDRARHKPRVVAYGGI